METQTSFLSHHNNNIFILTCMVLFVFSLCLSYSQSLDVVENKDPFKTLDKPGFSPYINDGNLLPVDIRSLSSNNENIIFYILNREEFSKSSCWAVISPTFYSYRAVALQKIKRSDALSYKLHSLWFGNFREWTGVNKKTDLSEIKLTHREITSDLAEKIVSVWKRTCELTGFKGRDPQLIRGVDGISYYFGFESFCGMAWTPENGTAKMLSDLAEKVFDYCNFIDNEKDINDICNSLSEYHKSKLKE